jgi:hypothetical protein
MSGYISETEDTLAHLQTGGAAVRKQNRIVRKTLKQRMAAKARHDARKLIQMTDTIPREVRMSGFHYDDESGREVLEESRELGNQSDNESGSNRVIKQHSLAYRVVSSKRSGTKPKVQIRGLAVDYDNTQSPFVSAAYLNNGKIVEGVLNTAVRLGDQTITESKPRVVRRRKINKTTGKQKRTKNKK